MPRPIIIGIDPGTTAAIAFVDGYGEPIEVKSSRKYSKEKFIQEIREAGTPLIIGTDKSSLPSSIEEVATKFHCKVNTPSEDLSQEKKSQLVGEYTHLAGNEHEKDALASALQAYRSYASQLEKIRQRNKDNYEEVVRKKFLDLPEEGGKHTEEQKRPRTQKKSESTENYRKQVKNLQEEIKYLQSKLEDKKERVRELEDRISRLKERKGITDREALLESKIAKLKKQKREINRQLRRFAEAHGNQEIKRMNEEEMKRKRTTEDPETFQKLKEKGKEAHLVDILLETSEEMYYKEIDHCKPSEDLVKDMVSNYREKRRKN